MFSKFFNFIINLQYAGWNLRNIVQNVKIAGMEGRQKKIKGGRKDDEKIKNEEGRKVSLEGHD